MNQNYKTIFSRIRQCFVVVSELTKSQGKGSRASRVLCTLFLGACLAGVGQPAAWGAPDGDGAKVQGNSVTASGTESSAWGHYAKAYGNYSTAFGSGTAGVAGDETKGSYATAFGFSTVASGTASTAFGWRTTASESATTAFGDGTTASGWGSTAFGYKTTASGDYSTAFGDSAKASGKDSTAFGDETEASGRASTAFGIYTVAEGGYATAFGSRTKASGEHSTAFGYGTTASGENSTAFGDSAKASGKDSTAFGDSSEAKAGNSLAALGGIVETDAANSAAIGKWAKAAVADTVALGSGSVASRKAGADDAYLKGSNSGNAWVSTHNAIAVGDDNTVTRQITGVAAGSKDTDAVNVAQLKAVAAADSNTTNKTLTVSGDAEKTITLTDSDNKAVTAKFTDKDTTYTAGKNIEINGTEISAIDTNTQSTVKHADSSKDYLTVTSADNSIGTKDYTVALTDKANTAIGNASTFLTSSGFSAGGGKVTVTDQGFAVQGGPSMTADGINAGGKKIANVADGTDSKDAVNYGQLQKVDQKIESQDNALRKLAHRDAQLERKIYRAGAHAAAIAALHPLDYDEDHKFTAAAGVGQYHGSSAMAVGAFYRPTENLMFSVGASLNENDSMVNAGMAYRFGTGSGNKTSPDNIHEMKRQISTLSEENRQLSAQLSSSEAKLASSDAKILTLEEKIRRIEKMLKLK